MYIYKLNINYVYIYFAKRSSEKNIGRKQKIYIYTFGREKEKNICTDNFKFSLFVEKTLKTLFLTNIFISL